MHQALALVLASGFLTLAACQKDASTVPSTTLEGTWRLSHRQCYCSPTPLPNETVTFTATQFTFFSGNRATRFGDYALTTAAVPCFNNGATGPALQFTYFSIVTTLPGSVNVQYRINGDTLTLDYGGPCDAPVDTYERLK